MSNDDIREFVVDALKELKAEYPLDFERVIIRALDIYESFVDSPVKKALKRSELADLLGSNRFVKALEFKQLLYRLNMLQVGGNPDDDPYKFSAKMWIVREVMNEGAV